MGEVYKMEQYKLTVGIEPTDEYKKAKQDLIQAMQSFQKLSPQQRQLLAEELFGAYNVMALSQINIMQQKKKATAEHEVTPCQTSNF